MKMYYSTRDVNEKVSFSEGVLKGLSANGGLFVPEKFEKIDIFNEKYLNADYKSLAFDVLSKYLNDFTEEEIKWCIDEAYNEKFETDEIVSIKDIENVSFLELYRGPTLAFKDMALSILPKFMKVSKEKNNEDKEIVILTATSGDTGKAALEGFANNEGIKIIVFFPTDGVSEVQKAQMVTQTGDNTFVVAINGNFDDAQSGVKEIFNDVEFNKLLDENGYVFSSANSINIGRLVPQIIYYFYGYFNLIKNKKIKAGDKINVVVPTGNFGNILASYYAFKMGLPVNKFICASNINNVLTDFLNTGIYDINRKFNTTISPSMDILISSNLERFIESLTDKDDKLISELMNSLKTNGKYELPNELKEKLNKFYGGYADDEATKTTIKSVFDKYSYVIDTHTAVAYKVYEDYIKETNDKDTKTLIASTASPFKFTRAVLESIVDKKLDDKSDFELIEELAKTTNLEIPKAVFELDKKEVLHKTVIDSDKMKDAISSFLKIK